jgi:cardiolipin synthase
MKRPLAVPILKQFAAVPNLLTMLRLFALPFLVIVILDGHWEVGFSLMMVAGITDAFDGLLARLLHQHTRLGEYLDPIADKLLLSTLFLTLTHVGLIPRYVSVLVFSRDLGILLISTLLFVTNTLRDFRPSWLGKANTCLQIFAVVGVMASQVWPVPHLPAADHWLLRLIAVLAPLSAAQYAWLVVRRVSTPVEPGVAP